MLVEDAYEGRTCESYDDLNTMQRYQWYHQWGVQLFFRILVLVHMSLAFFETPASIPLSHNTIVTAIWTAVFELCVLGIYIADMLYKRTIIQPRSKDILANKLEYAQWATIVLSLLDLFLAMIVGLAAHESHYQRWNVFIRPFFVIYYFPSVRHYFKNMKDTALDTLHVFAVLFGLILFYVVVIQVLLAGAPDPGFPNTGRGFITMYITATTANYPNVMVYSVSNLNALWSIIYVSYSALVTKVMIALLTAVIYNRYQFHLLEDAKAWHKIKVAKLTKAFEQLDTNFTRFITLDEWTIMLSRLRPHYSSEKIYLMFQIIDENNSQTVGLSEFLRICRLLRLDISVQSSADDGETHLFKRLFPAFYRHPIHKVLKRIVTSRVYVWLLDIVVLANVVSVIIYVNMTVPERDRNIVEAVLLAIFDSEALFKLLVLGPSRYWASDWNKFDLLLCLGSTTSLILMAFPQLDQKKTTISLLIFSIFRMWRLGRTLKPVRSLYQTMWRLVPTLGVIGLALVVVYYEFAQVGMKLWAGKLVSANGVLNGSDFQVNAFWDTSTFNTFGNSVLTLYELMVQNNWYIIAYACELVSTPASWVYFVLFDITTAIVIANVLVAFILDGFITQWKLENLKVKSKVQMRIEELAAACTSVTHETTSTEPATDSEINFSRTVSVPGSRLTQEELFMNTVWVARDKSFKLDPLEFLEDFQETAPRT